MNNDRSNRLPQADLTCFVIAEGEETAAAFCWRECQMDKIRVVNKFFQIFFVHCGISVGDCNLKLPEAY